MDGYNKKARNLLQQEPGQKGRHIDGNDDVVNVTQVRRARQHHETADDYAQIVVRLNVTWRVVVCKHGIQWILQRRDAKRSGQPRWKAVGYFRTRNALIRVSRTSCGGIAPAAQAILDALPEMIGKGGHRMTRMQIQYLMHRFALTEAQAHAMAVLIWGAS